MTTDGFSRDRASGKAYEREQIESSQKHRILRRRDDRSRRRRLYLISGLGFVLLLVLIAPSLICHSPLGRSIIAEAASSYGWDARVENFRIGWITPLRLDGLELRGATSKSEISIEQIETELTILRLMSSTLSDLGEITARGIVLAVKVSDGRSSLEDDLAVLMSGPSSDTIYTANIHLQNIGVIATDAVTDRSWKLAQSNADLEMNADGLSAQFAGVLTEPSGSGGAMQGSVAWSPNPPSDQPAWQLRLQCESLPVSIVSLARRRVGEAAASIPAELAGDSTGRLSLDGFTDGRILVSPEQIEIRNFTASDPSLGEKVWSNRMATLDGVLVIDTNRIVGKQFQVGTDFAFASMDGSISTAFSIAGTSDNPVQWLDALNGVASAEVDLAMLDRALPGILPLRNGAEIVSGKISARIDTLPSDAGAKRSQLKLDSQAIRARTGGQNIVVEPVTCIATVINDHGQVSAEIFRFTSTFASAKGSGDMRAGNADIEIDFGRLASTLQPIVDLSASNLAGTASGNIRWNATTDNVWRLDGIGQASNVVVMLPGGQRFSRPTFNGEVSAVGQWDGQTLSELSKATVSLTSTGINLSAALIAPVHTPSAETLLPIQVRGAGRIEALTDIIGPWLPTEIHDCEGGFNLVASGDASATSGRVTNVQLTLVDPRFAYVDRYFMQPDLEVKFDGSYAWPSGELVSKECTIKGNALTAAVQGTSNEQGVDIELAWNAKLERIQGSVRSKVAVNSLQNGARQNGAAQAVGFRNDPSLATEDWLVKGDFTGNMRVKSQDDWYDMNCESTGANLAVMQPSTSSAQYNTVGPAPPNRAVPTTLSTTATTVWSEPNFKLNGNVRYHKVTGEVVAKDLQLAGDWFAASLSGRMISNESLTSVELQGPGKLKMDEVGRLLTSLSGTPIQATGLHETPLEIRIDQIAGQDASINVAAKLGWESAEIGGVVIGPTVIPVRMTGTTLFIEPATVPLAQGKINLAGEVHYRPGPIWIRATPGRFAESVRLTREMNERWLKYLAPLAADAAQIDGVLGVTLDEAIIVLESPEKNRVVGRLDIEGINMTAGPLSNQIISGVAQLRALAQATLPEAQTPEQSSKTLVTMPAQTVDFSMIDGVVSHQRLFFQIDRAQVVTSGRVDMESRLNMVAQIPLDPRWLGRDLQGLTGQSVNLPIEGTLSRPRLDSSGVRQVVTQLGAKAVQNAADNFLQQNLSKGLDKIFGN